MKSLERIKNNLPKTFSRIEIKIYLDNTKEIQRLEGANIDKGYLQTVKRSNFMMIRSHIEKNN